MKHLPPPSGPRRTVALALAGGLFALLLPSAASADLPAPGMHDVQRLATVDLGPFADYTVRWYRVGKGDTLSEISETHLGKTDRWKEIAALNPGLSPDTLKAGTEILLPPRKTPRPPGDDPSAPEEARVWWDFFTRAMPDGPLRRLDVDGKIPPSPSGGTQLVAVRHDRTAELLAEMEHQGAAQELLARLEREGKAYFALSEAGLARYGKIEDASPVVRLEAAYRVKDIGNGRIDLELLSERSYAADGREVTPGETSCGPWNLLLAILAVAAAALIVWRVLAARRRPGAGT